MTEIVVAIVTITVLAAWIASRTHEPLARTVRSTPISPLDEAERILARRYARREITSEEYDRMVAILKR